MACIGSPLATVSRQAESSSNMINQAHGPGSSSFSRRQFLRDAGAGLGSVALAWMLGEESRASGASSLHFPARAKRIVQIFACGGVSHVDTFDHKPELARLEGRELIGKGKVDTFFGRPGRLMKTPFRFRRWGESGQWISSLLPHLAECADDLTVIRSMVAKSSNHTPATFQMNSGFSMNGFPCMGAWLSYGLGTENQDLPTFVVLPDPVGFRPAGRSTGPRASCRPRTRVSRSAHPATQSSTCIRPRASRPVVGNRVWPCWRR